MLMKRTYTTDDKEQALKTGKLSSGQAKESCGAVHNTTCRLRIPLIAICGQKDEGGSRVDNTSGLWQNVDA